MLRLFGKAGTSIKRLLTSLPFFSQRAGEVPLRPLLEDAVPFGSKRKSALPMFALAGTLLALGTGGVIAAKQSLEKDSIENRAQVTQYPANNPCEDTYNVKQLMVGGKKQGYYAAVFDGHGGWQMAEYAKKNLHVYVEEELKKILGERTAGTEEDYKKAIEAAFDRVENEFLAFSKDAFQKGFPNAAYVGACALVAIVSGNKLYVASAGDCMAGLIRETPIGYRGAKASKRFSANKKSEQQRLHALFSDEPDIVICVPDSDIIVGVEVETRVLREGKRRCDR